MIGAEGFPFANDPFAPPTHTVGLESGFKDDFGGSVYGRFGRLNPRRLRRSMVS